MAIANQKNYMDQRIDERRPYSGHIFLIAKEGFSKGRLKDYSRSGLFIITKTRLGIGEIIAVAIPYADDKLIKCRGKIVRKDKDGFGIELIKKRSKANLRIIKSKSETEKNANSNIRFANTPIRATILSLAATLDTTFSP